MAQSTKNLITAEHFTIPLRGYTTNEPNTFLQAAERFTVYLNIELNRSEATVQSYGSSLKTMAKLLQYTSLKDVTDRTVSEYKTAMRERKNSPRTINWHLSVFKMFLDWIKKEEGQDLFNAERITFLNVPETESEYFTAEEMHKFLEQPDLTNIIGLRDRAMFELLYSTGMRVNECRTLDKRQLNLEQQQIQIIGKGGKKRLVFIDNTSLKHIEAYLCKRNDVVAPLFIKNHKEAPYAIEDDSEKFRLSRVTYWNLVKKYTKMARINKNASPHTIRHTFASQLLMNGSDVFSVQKLLGHSLITTTQNYLHVSNNRLRENHARFLVR